MLPARLACLMMALTFLLWQGVRPTLAQQAKEHKVFTNEDVASPAPSTPAAETAAAEATEPAEPSEAADSAEAVPESVNAVITTPTPSYSIKLARDLQDTLRKYLGEYSNNLAEETEPTRQERLRKMITSLMSLLQVNEQFISELDEQIKQQQEQQAQQSTP